jgi:hypothetical protein
VAIIVAIITFLVIGGLQMLAGITGLPWWVNILLATATGAWFGIGLACLGLSFAGWKSGRTVWIIFLMAWCLVALFFLGSRVFLFGADLYQWSMLAKWGMFIVIWIGIPIAIALWLLLAKVEGDRRALGAFVILALISALHGAVDSAQYVSYRSPFSGAIMVKACVWDGEIEHSHPIPVGAEFCREHQWVTTFTEVDPREETGAALLAIWSGYHLAVGDSDEARAARAECAAAKAAAKAAGQPEPQCSVTGMQIDAMPSGLDGVQVDNGSSGILDRWGYIVIASGFGIGLVIGLLSQMGAFGTPTVGAIGGFVAWLLTLAVGNQMDGDVWAGYRKVASPPFMIELAEGQEAVFKADLYALGQQGGPLQLVVCSGTEPNKLEVANGRMFWAPQYAAELGVSTSLVYNQGADPGPRLVRVRYVGRGRITAVIAHGSNAGMGCPRNTVGGTIAREKAGAKAAKKAAAPPVVTTP